MAGGGTVDTKTKEVLGNFIAFSPRATNKDIKTSTWPGTEAYTSFTQNTADIRIPYEWFGLKPGDTIRICFREPYDQTGIGYSEDKLLKLK